MQEKQLIVQVLASVVRDLTDILKYETTEIHIHNKSHIKRCLENWWAAKKYWESGLMEQDCEELELGPTWAYKQNMTSLITRGRKIYGRLVKSLDEIELPEENFRSLHQQKMVDDYACYKKLVLRFKELITKDNVSGLVELDDMRLVDKCLKRLNEQLSLHDTFTISG